MRHPRSARFAALLLCAVAGLSTPTWVLAHGLAHHRCHEVGGANHHDPASAPIAESPDVPQMHSHPLVGGAVPQASGDSTFCIGVPASRVEIVPSAGTLPGVNDDGTAARASPPQHFPAGPRGPPLF
ncbi:MAG: hypothetical protein HY700_11690 [Gemmatimonadetes bacterium]|nr:hypothetical protein [Gemmatimonadota bacterium]